MSRHRPLRAGTAALLVVAVAGGAIAGGTIAGSRANPSIAATPEEPANTAAVERGTLAAMISLDGTLTYRARADGVPHVAINQARGTYTGLPDVGDEVGCGDELHRVDDRPVLLLCGTVPAYRDLHEGDQGNDVRQLNANLHALGHDAAAGVDIDPEDHLFTDRTGRALEVLQGERGVPATGVLAVADAVFLPEPLRIAEVTAQLGGPAQPGVPVVKATTGRLEVQVDLRGSQQREIEPGDLARITLPSNSSVTGKVDHLDTVARVPPGPDGGAGTGPATLAAAISLDDPHHVLGLDGAPVRVEVATRGVDDVLSVPVTAIVGRSGGGYAVEIVREGERRELATVELGLVDTTGGRVQVDGEVREGDRVVVPSS